MIRRFLFYSELFICYYFPMPKDNKNLRAVVITAEGFEDEEEHTHIPPLQCPSLRRIPEDLKDYCMMI